MQGEIKLGYKQTDVGVIPADWQLLQGAEITKLIGKGASPRWQGFSYTDSGMLFVTSENVRDGFLDLEKPKYLPLAFHEKIKRTKLKKGDLLINLVGASIGRSCLVDRELGEANVNQAVSVFRCSEAVFPEFVSQCFQLPATIDRILGMQVEAARPNISLGDLRRLWFICPPLPEQRAIAAALADADGLIAAFEGMIAKKRDLKQATMQHLLTGRTRLPGFSGEWEVKRLGDLLEYEQPTKYLVSSTDYDDSYDIPVLTAGKSFLLGHTNESHGVFTQLPVIIFDDFTTATQFVDFPFKAKSSAMKLLKPRNTHVNLRLVCDMMQTIEFVMSDHKRYWISEYQKIEVPLPDPAEQAAIAEVLSDMDADLATLEAQAVKARAVKQGMMQELLTGRVRLL